MPSRRTPPCRESARPRAYIVPRTSSSVSPLPPLSLGVCSSSLQVTNIPELRSYLDELGINVVQIACGDPHHASWHEGEFLPEIALASRMQMTGAMLGFPGEDYPAPL